MDLATARAEVRARLQELNADFWTDAEVDRAINEGVNRFAQEEKWPYLYSVSTTKVLTAGANQLALETGVDFSRHFNLLFTLTGDTRPRAPRRVSPAEGYKLRLTFYTDSQEPMVYYLASVANSNGVYTPTVFFVPSLSRAANIEYQYIRTPVPVVNSTDYLDIPGAYAMGALAYATGHLFLKELNFSQKSEEQFALYRKSVDDAKKEFKKLTMDSGLAWGRNEPEWGFYEDDVYTQLVTPPTLG